MKTLVYISTKVGTEDKRVLDVKILSIHDHKVVIILIDFFFPL